MLTMASTDKCYPDYLNPFGSDDEEEKDEEQGNKCKIGTKPVDEYPDYLSPFDDIEEQEAEHTSTAINTTVVDDYDDSLNPFGDNDQPVEQQASQQQSNETLPQQQVLDDNRDLGEGNPFAEDLKVDLKEETKHTPTPTLSNHQLPPSVKTDTFSAETTSKAIAISPQETRDKPPVPLPRTRSLLKKELAAQRRKQQLELSKVETSNHNAISISPQLAEKNDSLLEEER